MPGLFIRVFFDCRSQVVFKSSDPFLPTRASGLGFQQAKWWWMALGSPLSSVSVVVLTCAWIFYVFCSISVLFYVVFLSSLSLNVAIPIDFMHFLKLPDLKMAAAMLFNDSLPDFKMAAP